jgi:hypothetical protein
MINVASYLSFDSFRQIVDEATQRLRQALERIDFFAEQ